METKPISKGHLFLLELIIVILFFAFAGAIALQVFSKAHTVKEDTLNLNTAMMIVQSKAEESKLADTPSDLKAINTNEFFNEDWQKSDKSNFDWSMESDISLDKRNKGTMAELKYSVKNSKDEELYTLTVKKYFSNGGQQ